MHDEGFQPFERLTATHVAGFHTWHKLGRFVKKGEKGILILARIVRAKNQGVEQTETDETSDLISPQIIFSKPASHKFQHTSGDKGRRQDTVCIL